MEVNFIEGQFVVATTDVDCIPTDGDRISMSIEMRRITEACLLNCKKALERTNCNMDEAMKLLIKNKEFS